MPNIQGNDYLYSSLLCSLVAWCVRRGTAVNLSGEQGNMAGNSGAASSEKGRGVVPIVKVPKQPSHHFYQTSKVLFLVHVSTLECLILLVMNEIIQYFNYFPNKMCF